MFLSYPLILDAVPGGVYDRPVRVTDVPGGGTAQPACRALGGAAIAVALRLAVAPARTAARC